MGTRRGLGAAEPLWVVGKPWLGSGLFCHPPCQRQLWGSPCSCWVSSLAVQTLATYEDHRQSERPLSAGCGRLTEPLGKFFQWEMEKPPRWRGAAELGRAGTGRAALRGAAPQTGNEEPGTGLCRWPVASAMGQGRGRGRVSVLTGAGEPTGCPGRVCTRSGCSGLSAAVFYRKKLAWHSWVR